MPAPQKPHPVTADGVTNGTLGGPSLDERCRGLLLAAATGDQAAFGGLHDLLSLRVYRVVQRVLCNHAQAEEVCQEVFLEIWLRGSKYDPRRGSACGWLVTVAHRRAVDRVRTEEASARRDTCYYLQSYRPVGDDTADQALRHLDAERVNSAMAGLTPLQRGAVELAFEGGYTHREVAVLLEVPLGTAKGRIRDGLIRLRAELSAA